MIGRDPTDAETWLLSLPPTRQQTRWVIAIALCQVAALVLLAPFASIQLAQINGFIPAVGGVIFVTDLVTAVLLFSQFATHRRRALLVLACGYLLSALMIMAYTLTFPGVFSPTGLLGAGLQTTAWLYWSWHLPFALVLLGYGLIKDKKSVSDLAQASSLAVIVLSVALVVALAGGLALLTTAGHDYLPVLFAGTISRVRPLPTQGIAPITTLVCVSALAVLWLRRRSLLDQWLMVVALAAILEIWLTVLLSNRRFDLGFYAGRIFSLLTSTIVLVVLLVETMRLYARAEIARQLGETFLAEAQQLSRTGSFGWNVSKGEIFWSAETYRIFDYEQGTGVTFDTVLQRVHPEDRARVQAAIDRAATDREAFNIEHRLQMPNGSVKHLHVVAHAVVDKPQDLQFAGAVMDVTMAKEAERALKQSETRYQNLFQAMAVSFFELDYTGSRQILRALRDARVHDFRSHFKENPRLIREIMRVTRVVDVNDQTVALFGRGNREGLLTSVGAFWPEESLDDYVEAVLATIEGNDKFSIETRVRRLDGTIFEARFTLRYVTEDKTRGLVGVIDITERKRAEEALRESERNARLIVDSIPGLVGMMTPTGEIEAVNRQILEYYGKTLEELKRCWETCVHPEDLPRVSEVLRQSIASGEPIDVEFRARRFDGIYRWLQNRGDPLRDANGRIVRWYNLVIDIDERKRAEEALQQSEQRLRSAIDGIPGLVGVLAANGAVEAVNRQILEYTGQSLEDLKNWGTNGTVHPEDLPHVAEVFGKSIASGIPYQIEQRLRRHDGEYRWFDNRGIPVRDDSGRIARWYVLLTDIEDRTQAQARLQQMQSDFAHVNRVNTMGELAASLSHEILHPIATARNNARAGMRFLEMNPPNLDEAKEALSCVVRDSDRAKDIVGRVRDHIKKAPPRSEPFDLNEAVREALVMVRSVIARNRITVNTHLMGALVPVQGDRVQLQQVVVNLILNAVESMGSNEKGARELSVRVEQDQADGGVLVQVRDSGPGIDPKRVEQVFEPFYTTKTSGVGMGLSICRTIINGHGGRLWAEANEPRGAIFQFTLPPAQEGS
jgi:PAS domain S-box-containing protein